MMDQLGKLLWRKMKIMAKDMDRHAPSWRRHSHHRSTGGAATASPDSSSGRPNGVQPEEGGEQQEIKDAGLSERETLLEVARLNAAQSLDDIERQINRVLVEGNLDQKWVQGRGKDRENSDDDEYVSSEDLDEVDMEHFRDLEEALEDIPTTDPDEEGFDLFRQYADQLIKAGGTLSYTYNGSDRYDRQVTMPLPLPTADTLRRSLAIDAQVRDAAPGDITAHAWMSLAKNPNTGEQKRVELTRHLARTINQLSKKHSILDSTAYLSK